MCCVFLLGQYQPPWQPQGQYGASNCPMAASDGFAKSHGCTPLGDVHGTVLPQRHVHQNHCQFGYIFHVYDLAKLLRPCPRPTPRPRHPHNGLGETIKLTDHHGGGVCVVCSIELYYSYVNKSMKWEFFVPTGILIADNLLTAYQLSLFRLERNSYFLVGMYSISM